jgi:hypothetical protein
MSHRNEIKLLLYDYKLVGTTMGTHSSVTLNDLEYWYSITGIKKRNRRTGTVFTLNERLKKWEQQIEKSQDLAGAIQHWSKNITNLGSISTNSKRPRQIIHCGTTAISETGFESNLKSFIFVEFSSSNYNLESMNCNTFSRFLIQYFDPTEKVEGLEALGQIILETAETFLSIENGIRDAKDQVVDFVSQNGPLVVMGAAAATGFMLKKLFG